MTRAALSSAFESVGDCVGDDFAVKTAVLDEDLVGMSARNDDARQIDALALAFQGLSVRDRL